MMSIKEAQETVDRWIKEYGVRYFNELTNMALLTEEVGEVARIIARGFGEQSDRSGKGLDMKGEGKEQLADEMADVLFVLICLANQCDINLDLAFRQNLAKKTGRDFERHQQNDKLT